MNTETKYTSDITDVDNMDGLEFEEFCCELLRYNGYTNVKKTQASGDYGLDVIATKDGIIYGIQCKNYQDTVGVSAIQEAKTGSSYYNCDIAVVLTNSTFTRQAIEIASGTNVKLWDRYKLIELMNVFPEKENVYKNTGENKYTDSTVDIKDVDAIGDIYQFESFCCDLLKYNGFTNIRTTVGIYNNKSSLNDRYITAIKGNVKYLIRCKFDVAVRYHNSSSSFDIRSNNLTSEYINKIVAMQKREVIDPNSFYSNSIGIILTNGFFRREDFEIAQKNNIKLWDRTQLIELLRAYPRSEYIQKKDLQDKSMTSAKYGTMAIISVVAIKLFECLKSTDLLVWIFTTPFALIFKVIAYAMSIMGVIKSINELTTKKKNEDSKDNIEISTTTSIIGMILSAISLIILLFIKK